MSIKLQFSSQGQGKDLVLLHGWGLNSGVWQGILPSLSSSYRVTSIDLPGYGHNHSQLPDVYDLDSLADCIAKYLPENCILACWSLGGLVAQQIALKFPEKLNQLILICSTPKFSQHHDWHGIEEKVLKMFSEQLTIDFSKTLERFMAIQAMGSPSARHDIKQLKRGIEDYPSPSPIALAEGLKLLNECDLRQQLNQLKVPCHAFLGRLDSLVPVKIEQQLASFSESITTQVLPKASHAPFISDPEIFVDELKKAIV